MKLLVRSATSIESATSSDVRSKIISDLGQDGTNMIGVIFGNFLLSNSNRYLRIQQQETVNNTYRG